ncbi:MAG TPA: SPOR domain-containing protein [Caldimonas sp.]|nr:SPOR domain-containing protein [Caldimonas sp.]
MFKQKSEPTATPAPADPVQQARARARQRLIGAVVLLAIGIIGFPLVFETQPRPIPVDIPIEIPRKDAVPPLVAPPAPLDAQRVGPGAASAAGHDGVITESQGESGRDVTPADRVAAAKPRVVVPAAPASTARAVTAPAMSSSQEPSSAAAMERTAAIPPAASRQEPAREEKEKTRAEASRVERERAEAARAKALLEGRSVAAAAASRYVVQVGAFADAQAAREVRQKVEKLGLKTYTQIAQTSAGSRIRVRVGPFASRDEADAALAKAKAAGLAAVVVTL